MDDYISISMLNDFVFCPYSIYLNVYMDTDEGLYHAKPQTRGKLSHYEISTNKTIPIELPNEIETARFSWSLHIISCNPIWRGGVK